MYRAQWSTRKLYIGICICYHTVFRRDFVLWGLKHSGYSISSHMNNRKALNGNHQDIEILLNVQTREGISSRSSLALFPCYRVFTLFFIRTVTKDPELVDFFCFYLWVDLSWCHQMPITPSVSFIGAMLMAKGPWVMADHVAEKPNNDENIELQGSNPHASENSYKSWGSAYFH